MRDDDNKDEIASVLKLIDFEDVMQLKLSSELYMFAGSLTLFSLLYV